MRPSWNRYFIGIAKLISSRSTCIRRQVGAVIVKNNRILSTGYNGAPSGITHCTQKTCLRNIYNIPEGERHEICRGLHAEQNAIIQAALHGVKIKGAVIYTTHFPCIICSKMIINAGIKKIYYLNDYKDKLRDDLLKEADIKIIKIKKENNEYLGKN